MGRKARSKRNKKSKNSESPAQQSASASPPADVASSNASAAQKSESSSSPSNANAGGEVANGDHGQEEQAILAECKEALNKFRASHQIVGYELIKKAVVKYPNSGLACGLHSYMCAEICEELTKSGVAHQDTIYFIAGISSALRARQLEPKAIEYVLLYANMCLKNPGNTLADYRNLRRLCDDALDVEDPVHITEGFVTIHSSPECRLEHSAVRSELRNVVATIKNIEKRWKEVQAAVEAARLEQQKTISTSLEAGEAQRHDNTTLKRESCSEPADLKKDLNKEVNDQSTQDEQKEEDEVVAAAARQEQKPHDVGKARKSGKVGKRNKGRKKCVPSSGHADQKTAMKEEILDQVTQDEQKKVVEHVVPGAGLEQKPHSTSLDAGQAQKPHSASHDAGQARKPHSASHDAVPHSTSQDAGQAQKPHSTPQDAGQAQKPHSTPHDAGQAQKPHSTPHDAGQAQKPHSTPHDAGQAQKPHSTPHDAGQAQKLHSTPHDAGQAQKPHSTPHDAVQAQKPHSTSHDAGQAQKPHSASHDAVPHSTPQDAGLAQKPHSTPQDAGQAQKPHSTPQDAGQAQKPHSTPHDVGHAQKPHSTPHDAGQAQKPHSTPHDADQAQKPHSTPHDAGQAQTPHSTSYDAGQAQKHSNTLESTATLDPADHEVALNKELPKRVTQDEQLKESEPTVATAKLKQKSESELGNTSESTNTCSEPADQKIAQKKQLPDWIPQDDGIEFSLPGLPAPTREEVLEYFHQLIHGPSTKISMLTKIGIPFSSEPDVPRSSKGSPPANK